MVTALAGEQLLGREREFEVLNRLLDGVRGGQGGVLVLHGEAGVGKTALLEYAVEAGRGLGSPAPSGSTYKRAERGVLPRPGTANRIADYFDVAVSDLWPVRYKAGAFARYIRSRPEFEHVRTRHRSPERTA